ncbi:Uncharacterised protein [Staphylococcus aureus]|nr:Uncharacterised protein [Staphylococcus aureus]
MTNGVSVIPDNPIASIIKDKPGPALAVNALTPP